MDAMSKGLTTLLVDASLIESSIPESAVLLDT